VVSREPGLDGCYRATCGEPQPSASARLLKHEADSAVGPLPPVETGDIARRR
jgi:hypothetical protein